MEDFEYVIQKQEKQRICFGSGLSRDMSRKGMSPFMRYYTKDDYANIGPTTYNVMDAFLSIKTKPCINSISKKGYSGIIRTGKVAQHIDDYPPPGHYNIDGISKPLKKSKYPFSSSTKRTTLITDINPGPGTYNPMEKKEIPFEHSFGGRVKMRLGVQFKCCSNYLDTCKICGQKPEGDYWHWNNKVFLCRLCMTNEFKEQFMLKRKELENFVRLRNCSDVHCHESTKANIWLMHPKLLKQRFIKETYLTSYLKD